MPCSRSASTSRHCSNIAASIALSLLLLIHLSHGSVEAKPPLRRARPALASPPPLPERGLQTVDASIPTFSPIFTPTITCYDTPGWTDAYNESCDYYELNYEEQECDNYGGTMGPANDNCCHCGGGSEIPPTVSPTLSGAPSSSSAPTRICYDTPGWTDLYGNGCDWYEWYDKHDDPGCPDYGSYNEGTMGVADDHCCYCGGGSPTTCQDTPGWFDSNGYDCPWYEVVDDPGCPKYGDGNHLDDYDDDYYYDDDDYYDRGVAKDNCCHCKNAIAHSVPATEDSSSSSTCVDTPEWEDVSGDGCEWHKEEVDIVTVCFTFTFQYGMLEPAHCCYCKDTTCEDFKSACRKVIDRGNYDSLISTICEKEASCSCEDAVPAKLVTNHIWNSIQTVGLRNDCKCDFWYRLCEDTLVGEACDYAAEYCCGDYRYSEYYGTFNYMNSPSCYCDFYNYARNELDYKLKPTTIDVDEEFNNPCEEDSGSIFWDDYERDILEAIYEATNGPNWTNNDGWMSNETGHCNWYGITCNSENHVIRIELNDNNLAGQFPVYTQLLSNNWRDTKSGLASLYYLQTVNLAGNKLTGTIDPLYNLEELTTFDVSGNKLIGEFDALVAPSVKHVDFSNNGFTTMHGFKKYKGSFQTLQYFDVSNNAIEKNAADFFEHIPPSIEQLYASSNMIYGNLPQTLDGLSKLRKFNMSSNALSGTLPRFSESFTTLQELDVSNQRILEDPDESNQITLAPGLSGSIPEDIWRFLSLKVLNLAGNRLEGSISPFVSNLAVLEVFNLSSNRLVSSIPLQLGMLEGSLKHLDLSHNRLTGIIPSELDQLQGASILLKSNDFKNSSAPLSLCLQSKVQEFDLANETAFCPLERKALSEFYDSAKGREWTDGTNWKDEYASFCDWKGVTCNDGSNHVTKINLSNNGLSGRLSKSIGKLTFIKELDLSGNAIKGSIPTEIGLLSNLTYLRLSYNAFTGAAPKGLGMMSGLQLLQLQSNWITDMPNIPILNRSTYGKSSFVADCGVPSAFDEALKCDNCTMCCNANKDCYPQQDRQVDEWGLNYGTFAAALLTCFIVFCGMIAHSLYFFYWRSNRRETVTTSPTEDNDYALSSIGKDSVYSYFVTDNRCGWMVALATLVIQFLMLFIFVSASESNLQKDTIDVQFTWKCPPDTDVCVNKADLNEFGWVIFSIMMIASLAKDLINGSKLIHHSTKLSHPRKSRIQYFFGGVCLCLLTVFAMYVSIIYNKAIATSNTEIIVNSVIVLFIMQLDEWIFKALGASNVNWTAHVVESSNIKRGSTIDEMEDDIILLINKQLSDEVARGQEMEKQIARLSNEAAARGQEIETRLSNETARGQGMEKQIARLSDETARGQEMKKQIARLSDEVARGQEMEKQIARLSNEIETRLSKETARGQGMEEQIARLSNQLAMLLQNDEISH